MQKTTFNKMISLQEVCDYLGVTPCSLCDRFAARYARIQVESSGVSKPDIDEWIKGGASDEREVIK